MIEFYPQIKAVHVGCVLLSIALFGTRGLMMLAGWWRVALSLSLRVTSWTIDTTLLSSALLLLTILPGAMFANHWLALKLVLLLVYIGCGRMALQRRCGQGRRLAWYVAALATVAWMYGIAKAHHPLGWLHGLVL